jgi:hypothetical protein
MYPLFFHYHNQKFSQILLSLFFRPPIFCSRCFQCVVKFLDRFVDSFSHVPVPSFICTSSSKDILIITTKVKYNNPYSKTSLILFL